MQWEDGIDWTQPYTDEDRFAEIVSTGTGDDHEEDEEEGTAAEHGTYAKQLKNIAKTKLISADLGVDNEELSKG